MSRRGVQYVKQDQPAFLQKFKQRVGMKPEATLADKVQAMKEDCVDDEQDDEKPTVVVLNEGDLTAEEAQSHEKNKGKGDEKIVFRKPIKRTKDSGLNATTKKSKLDSNTRKDEIKKKIDKESAKGRSKKPKPASSSLLSFDENDDG